MFALSPQIREASQALLLAELRRIGVEGQQRIISDWSSFLPNNVDSAFSLLSESAPAQPAAATTSANMAGAQYLDDDDDDENLLSGGKIYEFAYFLAVSIWPSLLRPFLCLCQHSARRHLGCLCTSLCVSLSMCPERC